MTETTQFYNERAEKAVIAILSKGREGADVLRQLTPEDFHNPELRTLFSAMRQLVVVGKPIDLVSISDALVRLTGSDDMMPQLIKIQCDYGFDTWALKSYAAAIKDAALRRELYTALEAAKQELMTADNETTQVLDSTRQRLRDLVITGNEWQSMDDVLIATMTALEDRAAGKRKPMPSGITALDKLTAGFHKGEMTVIGARPAVGKSALGMYIALSCARQGSSVGVISREMTDEQYGARVLGSAARISSQVMRSGSLTENDWTALSDALQFNGGLPISFQFSARYVEDLRMEAQKLVDTGKLDMLVIDYLQLVQTRQRFSKDFERIGYVSHCIKELSTDLNIAVVALAQVGRTADGSMPTLAELRGSGEIEQDADNVIFMHHCESPNDKYVRHEHRDMFAMLDEKQWRYIVLNVAKQRQGQTGTLATVFKPELMHFTPIIRG